MTENFPKINVKNYTTGIGSSEYTKHNKCHKTTCRHIIVELQKIREEEKFLKEAKGEKHLTYRKTKIKIKSNYSS